MRRTETYRTNKLRLLHKLLGMRNLARHYDGERISSERLWYTGYYVYSNQQQVMNLFREGKPLCCTIFPANKNEMCVAHYSGNSDIVEFLVFSSFRPNPVEVEVDTFSSCQPGPVEVEIDTGVVFFKLYLLGSREANVSKQELKKEVQFNAIMLPYLKDNKPHESMYTIVLSDWDVLDVTDNQLTKGPVHIAENLHLDLLNADIGKLTAQSSCQLPDEKHSRKPKY